MLESSATSRLEVEGEMSCSKHNDVQVVESYNFQQIQKLKKTKIKKSGVKITKFRKEQDQAGFQIDKLLNEDSKEIQIMDKNRCLLVCE